MHTSIVKRIPIIALMLAMILVYFLLSSKPVETPETNTIPAVVIPEENKPDTPSQIPPEEKNEFQFPISRAGERITKKPFGIFITKENSPIRPERFSGYHTGVDFEVFLKERNIPVAITAICDGTLLLKKYAGGYGGVAVQSCTDDNARSITVVYGHLKLTSISAQKGSTITQGDVIGILGAGNSTETDGERKHLHLGIHQGNTINLLGYVGRKTDLTSWIDPLSLLANK